MNRPIRSVAVACLVMFVALLLNINYVQFVQAESLNNKNGNRRVTNEEFSRDRGPILVAGEPVADSVRADDVYKFQRRYSDGPLYAPITGYFSYIYGRGGLEYSQNPVLSGSDNRLFVSRVVDILANKQPKGGSVETTIDPLAQSAADTGMERLGQETRGAVVAIRPSTGEVLAMASHPSYDPSKLASHDLDSVESAWQQLNGDPTQPMLNRGTQQVLPPGSTFKLVTAAAALERLNLQPDDMVAAGPRLSFPGITYTLGNHDGGNSAAWPATSVLTPWPTRHVPSDSAPTSCPGCRAVRAGSRPDTWSRRSSRSPASASTRSRPRRCRWRWWPPRSATAARSCGPTSSRRCARRTSVPWSRPSPSGTAGR